LVGLDEAQQIFDTSGLSLPEGLDLLSQAEQGGWISSLEVHHDKVSFRLSIPQKKNARSNDAASVQSTMPEGLV
jgi:hypothetical protein